MCVLLRRKRSYLALLDFHFLSSIAVNIFAGILMWEVFTLGKQPYELYDNMQVIEKVSQGYRLYRPQLVSDIIYQIMYNCWHEVCVSAHANWRKQNNWSHYESLLIAELMFVVENIPYKSHCLCVAHSI